MNLSPQTMRLLRQSVCPIAVLLLCCAGGMAAGQIAPYVPPPPPPPVFDPYHAQKSIEIGTFYLKKGKYSAAIDRFREAARLDNRLAKPWKLMGEAYEKKHDDREAVKAYKKYLAIFPHARDASRMKKHISKLEKKIRKEATKRDSP